MPDLVKCTFDVQGNQMDFIPFIKGVEPLLVRMVRISVVL